MAQVQLSADIWVKIISFLDYHERILLESVSHQLSLISQTTWIREKKIHIDVTFSDAKVVALLHRCGQYLEEISTRVYLPQRYGGELLGQICPNLKSISFLGSSTFYLTNVPKEINRKGLRRETDRLVTSLCKLERLEFNDSNILCSTEDRKILSISKLLYSLVKISPLTELHIRCGSRQTSYMANLQHIRVLSISSCSHDILTVGICRLTQLRELMIDFGFNGDLFGSQMAFVIGENLKNLEFLMVDTDSSKLDYNQVVPILIERLPVLSNLVLRNYGEIYRRPKIDLSPYRHRPVRLNLFIDDRIRFVFVGTSVQVRLVPTVFCYDVAGWLSDKNKFDLSCRVALNNMLKCWN